MVKKVLGLVGAGALLLSMATPAFGLFGFNQDTAIVNNSASANANTGWNAQGNYVSGGSGDVTVRGDNWMSTGDAHAKATAVTIANTHVGCCPRPRPCGPRPCGGGDSHMDFALVTNSASAGADTGDNFQGNTAEVGGQVACSGHHCHHDRGDDVIVTGDNTLRTGDAWSKARAWTVVNTHLDL